MEHISVLLQETIDSLQINPAGIYVDATLGRGGHSQEVLKKLESGHLYAFDKDMDAIRECEQHFASASGHITLIHADFRDMREMLQKEGVEKVDGIMMDLGVSSPQFDDPERGFSYRYDTRLDMRMDQSQQLDAYEIVNTYSQKHLSEIFRNYGEERYAPLIAKEIIKQREQRNIETTGELVSVIRNALPEKVLRQKGHPAKQTFQALRIEVNHEFDALSEGLEQALAMLKVHGRLAVITFHSLEDRIVKTTFKSYSTAPFVEPKLPLKAEQMEQASFQLVTKKPIEAGRDELERNHRAHSARLRVIERIRG